MTNEKVFAMSFAKVYPMLITKAEREGRTRDEVLIVTTWLTGYTKLTPTPVCRATMTA